MLEMIKELPALITSFVGLLGAMGVAMRFIWLRIEARFVKIEDALTDCRERHVRGSDIRGRLLSVVDQLLNEVARLHPDSIVLMKTKSVMDVLRVEMHTLAHDDHA